MYEPITRKYMYEYQVYTNKTSVIEYNNIYKLYTNKTLMNKRLFHNGKIKVK